MKRSNQTISLKAALNASIYLTDSLRLVNLTKSVEARVDFHTSKILIIQFHPTSVWKNALHAIFVQFRKIVEKKKDKLISAAV